MGLLESTQGRLIGDNFIDDLIKGLLDKKITIMTIEEITRHEGAPLFRVTLHLEEN